MNATTRRPARKPSNANRWEAMGEAMTKQVSAMTDGERAQTARACEEFLRSCPRVPGNQEARVPVAMMMECCR